MRNILRIFASSIGICYLLDRSFGITEWWIQFPVVLAFLFLTEEKPHGNLPPTR